MSGTSLPKIRIGLAAGFSILKILKRNLPDVFLETLRLYQYYPMDISFNRGAPNSQGIEEEAPMIYIYKLAVAAL